jgi:ubiquinone/menaquinone biosynthesis C-methylase UbiE
MDTVGRFSSRVEDYIKYRPGYPAEIVDFLRSDYGLASDSVIADIGSGTGKLSELFLRNGNRVLAVEPNEGMRKAAEQLLSKHQNFVSINGSAESTTLDSACADFITAGQSFHWFDQSRAKVEFSRILKPGGLLVIIWNERRLNASPFLRDYEDLLLKFGTDYEEVRHENTTAEIAKFFAPNEFKVRSFDNLQELDFEGLKGRISSTSYTPEPGTSAFLDMLEALRRVFSEHAVGDRVVIEYNTGVYLGLIS